ncbi:ArdC family protein [Mucilaginibacter ginsenosidivorans]|uniref:DUF1738 domain-containing protein n=1 Tax=Mucilaginibacter ginsenosidivorans TaxID=398053 RepID=A0A5B8USR0_9SPHI|nr:zincin-like metallopeptidase domain-containing protein [Mucilaginibacter ginsenosidivorans]QEC61745.1 DUF1738 domain-containing protein [Mucilaginibacter ginsenosidivorans]
MNNQTPSIDVYQIITNRIIEQLAQQVIPWRKPWTEAGHPQNLISKRPYTGINTWLLASMGYPQNYFLTWKQIHELGASVKKGEKGHIVIFWKYLEEQQHEGQGEPRTKALLRYYYVFNIAQCDNLPEVLTIPFDQYDIGRIGACDEIIERMPNCPSIKHVKQKAYYDPGKDVINMPKQGSFSTPESYYCTLFHELIHSTGHQSRLNRKGITEEANYASIPYSMEELIAEIGACYLNSVAGIIDKEFDNSVAYIKGWIEALRNDKRLIIFASGQAQRGVDYILNASSKQKKESVNDEVLRKK